jgi:hypothetical protein
MNPAVQAVICGRRRLQVTQTFTANGVWTAPFTTSRLSASGYGAVGVDGGTIVTYSWQRWQYLYEYWRDGHVGKQFTGQVTSGSGHAPGSDYCDAMQYYTPSDPEYVDRISFQYCYEYHESSSSSSYPATTGASATAFGKTFPGSTGNVPQTTTTFSDIPITPGASYNIVVPAGGSITITYFQ